MRRILIVEDRTQRMVQMFGQENLSALGKLDSVRLAEFLPDDYVDYDVIAIHRSYLDRNKLNSALFRFIDDKAKRLIVFSGGNSRQEMFKEGRILILTAREFYSDKLIPFLKDISQDGSELSLAKLLYGDEWKLPTLVKIRNLEWQIEDGKEIYGKLHTLKDLRKSLSLDGGADVNKMIMDSMGL